MTGTASAAATGGGSPGARPMTGVGTRRLVAFRDDVVVERQADGLSIAHRWGNHVVADPSPWLAAALDRLTFGPSLPANVIDGVITGGTDPTRHAAELHLLLEQLQYLLVHSVEHDAVTVAEAVPMAAGARLGGLLGPIRRVDADLLRLSRFAYLHQVDGVLVLESPLSLYRARLFDPMLVALVAAAAQARTVRELLAGAGGAPAEPVARPVIDLLVGAGLLELVGATGATGTELVDAAEPARSTRLRQWGFHDLLFHTRSRSGRHDEEFGATFRFLDEIEHERPVRELPDGPRVPLPVPDLHRVLAADPQLTVALETRKSIRTPDKRAVDAERLGELLFRTARVRAVYGPDPTRQLPDRGVDKPYPATGGAGELDVWLTVRRCTDICPGIYYYDPAGHQLVLVNADPSDVDAMASAAALSAGNVPPPDVLATITARFQRMGWKYSGMAYATTLKHVGVLYQTLYLVCTAMGLAPCGLATGDIDLAARCLRLDWEREGSVGEFMISAATTARSAPGGNEGPATVFRSVSAGDAEHARGS